MRVYLWRSGPADRCLTAGGGQVAVVFGSLQPVFEL